MGKYRMCEPYGYQEGMGYVSNANSNGNAKAIVDDEIAKLIDGAPEAFNTLKEISDYIEKDEKGMSKMMSDINKNKSDITALKAKDNELQAAINSKASQSELNALKGNVYTKAESDSKYATEEWVNEQGFITDSQLGDEYATKEWVGEQGFITDGQLSEDYATKEWINEQGFLTEHQDISNLATKDEVEEVSSAVTAEIAAVAATIPTVPTNVSEFENDANYTTEQWVNEQGFLTEHQDISNLATKDEVESGIQETMEAIAELSTLIPTVPTNVSEFENDANYTTEQWVNEQGFLTEHQDISNLATKDEVESGETDLWEALNNEQAARIQNEGEVSSAITDLIETKQDKGDYVLKEDYDAMVQEKDAEISGLNASLYSLKKIVGDIGGAVTYDLPGEGKTFNTLMSNNGTVKLSEDVETGRFGPGITASNHVKLNLNTHNLTISGLTPSSAQAAIMARGTQEITIYGKGTIDAGQGICIEGNGASSVINLTGSTTVYRTNRSGGELVYCYSGTINIVNGTFRNDGTDKKFLLNCYDANYANGTAKIIVTGGKFYDFNPADNSAEGEHTNFVAEGYVSVGETVIEEGVEHTVYTVKRQS